MGGFVLQSILSREDTELDRLFIRKERKNYFIAIDDRGKKYKILKNDYSRKFSKNSDTYVHYSVEKKGIFYTIIKPISHEDFLKLPSREVGII